MLRVWLRRIMIITNTNTTRGAKNIGVVLRSGHYLNKMKSTKTVGIGNGKR